MDRRVCLDMNLDGILSTFSPEVRESASMKGMVILIRTLLEQLQATQEQLTKAQEKIKILEDELARLRKTPKRPKFRPNGCNLEIEATDRVAALIKYPLRTALH